jgi:hypothetical protein
VGALRLDALAATPRAVGDGRLWLLVTSALVADRPVLASLLGFAVVGFAGLLLFDVRSVVAVAAAGHVASTLAVYGAIAAARLADPAALASVLDLSDVGQSAIIAAWLGAISAWGWSRNRPAVVALCVASTAIGWTLRGSLTALDSEHVVAFALGVALLRLPGRGRAATGVPPVRALS